jgi:hypothetical protein
MPFSIHTEPSPRLEPMDPEDSTISEAIESVYGHGSAVRLHFGEKASARLPLSGGVSDIYDDVVRMLKRLEVGSDPFNISFLCSCFTTIWRFSGSELLTIDMRWTAVDGTFESRDFSNARFNEVANRLVVERDEFVSAWHALLSQLRADLLKAGYDGRLANFEYLDSLA